MPLTIPSHRACGGVCCILKSWIQRSLKRCMVCISAPQRVFGHRAKQTITNREQIIAIAASSAVERAFRKATADRSRSPSSEREAFDQSNHAGPQGIVDSLR